MDHISLPAAVENFIAATNAHDTDALVAIFGEGARVSDDDKTYTGETAILDWIRVHLINPRIVITPTSFADDRLVASGDGDFPGGPLSFAFKFGIKDDKVVNLEITPV